MDNKDLNDVLEKHSKWLARKGRKRADLSDTNLNGVDLSGADLREANFERASMAGASLVRADLSRATLVRVNLQNADLRNANLSGAFMAESTLEQADLRGANLEGADLTSTQFSKSTVMPDGLYGYYDDMGCFTDPQHPRFWRSDDPVSPACRSDDGNKPRQRESNSEQWSLIEIEFWNDDRWMNIRSSKPDAVNWLIEELAEVKVVIHPGLVMTMGVLEEAYGFRWSGRGVERVLWYIMRLLCNSNWEPFSVGAPPTISSTKSFFDESRLISHKTYYFRKRFP